MGEHVVNAGFGPHRQPAGQVWGMWWGNGDDDEHHSFEVTSSRLATLKTNATNSTDLADWVSDMTTAEAAWFTAQPSTPKDLIYEAAKD